MQENEISNLLINQLFRTESFLGQTDKNYSVYSLIQQISKPQTESGEVLQIRSDKPIATGVSGQAQHYTKIEAA